MRRKSNVSYALIERHTQEFVTLHRTIYRDCRRLSMCTALTP